MMRNVFDSLLFIIGSPALVVLLKTTLIAALGLLLVWFTSSARAAVRHLLLACTFVALLAVPVASLMVPAFSLEMESNSSAEPAATTNTAPLQNAQETSSQRAVSTSAVGSSLRRVPSLGTVAWMVWGFVAALLVLRLAISLFSLRRVRRSAIPSLELTRELSALVADSGLRRNVEVLLHNDVDVPFTFGLLRPAILLPNDAQGWSETDLRRVLVHELEHIKRGDWIVQVVARVVCACYWFQPLVWIAWRRICLEAERACDDAVLTQTERTDYAEQLVSLARRLSSRWAPPVLSMANRSDLSHRVSAILDQHQARGRAGMRWTTISIACSAVVIFGVAPELAISQTKKPITVMVAKRPYTIVEDELSQKVPDTRTPSLTEALIQATEARKLNDIERLLSAGADVNGVVHGDGTALIVAARDGNLDAVSLLLKHGADVNLSVSGDGNPLIMAAREGHEEIVSLLLDRGAQVNQVVEGDENALIQAAGSGRLGVVKLLLQRGADINARVWSGSRDGEWRTALLMAKRNGRKDVVDLLISLGAQD